MEISRTLILFWVVVTTVVVQAQRRVVCYYGSWAVYRPGAGKFDVENIDPHLCTHLIYTFVGLNWDNRVKLLDPWNDSGDNYGKNAMGRMVGLKKQNPALKVLLAVGGWNEGSTRYSQMAATYANRQVFVQSVVELLDKTGFDGFDVDWEYPTQRGGSFADKVNFCYLLWDLKAGLGDRILSAAVSAGMSVIDQAYDIPCISRYLDMINLMTYDLHGAWEQKTGHHTQLHPSDGDGKYLNVRAALTAWIERGAPAEKINLGLATYGRGWTLANPDEHGLNAPGYSPLPAGPYTREAGFWGYNEICEKLKNEHWKIVRDPTAAAPYACKGNLWIGYPDPESIKEKAEFALKAGLGGVMTWSLETDDFHGNCGAGTFPLIRTMRNVMIGGTPIPFITTTPASSKTTKSQYSTTVATAATRKKYSPTSQPQSITTAKQKLRPRPTPVNTCYREGFFRNKYYCSKFYRCVRNDEELFKYDFDCWPGTVFNEDKESCDWPQNVPECTS